MGSSAQAVPILGSLAVAMTLTEIAAGAMNSVVHGYSIRSSYLSLRPTSQGIAVYPVARIIRRLVSRSLVINLRSSAAEELAAPLSMQFSALRQPSEGKDSSSLSCPVSCLRILDTLADVQDRRPTSTGTRSAYRSCAQILSTPSSPSTLLA